MSTAPIYVEENRTADRTLKNADHIWHLKQSGLTENLNLRDVHRLADACTDMIFDENQTIYRQGDQANALLLVNRGAVRLASSSSEGREKVIAVLGTGDFFGEEAIAGPNSHRCRAVAHEDCWISIIPKEKLLLLMRECPSLSINLLRLLNRRLGEVQAELEVLSFSSTEERIARTLVRLSEVHGKNVVSKENLRKLKIAMSHERLSQMIGANRPHVSAIMSQFKKKGWIEYQGRKLLVDAGRLSSLVESSRRR